MFHRRLTREARVRAWLLRIWTGRVKRILQVCTRLCCALRVAWLIISLFICKDGVVDALNPGEHYLISKEAANDCFCNTVFYSVIGACAFCQDDQNSP